MEMQKVEDIPSFGIRPFLFEGETLSSYLHRIADENKVSFKNLVRDLTRNQNKEIARKLYGGILGGIRLDILPIINFDVNALASYLKKDEKAILNHSLFNLYQKFDIGENSEENFLKMTKKIFNTRERFFCPLCIKKKKGVYKMQWQFSGIGICEEHKCKLMNQCINCGGIQKYVHPGIGAGLCCECNNSLNGEIIPITDYESLSKSIASLNDFYFMVNTHSELCIQIKNFDKATSIAITIFYAIQAFFEKKQQDKIKFDINTLLQVIKETALRRLIWSIAGFNNFRIYLPTLIGVLKNINMTLVDFSRVKVPNDYIDSIFEYIEKLPSRPSSRPICKFKLCPSYNTSKLMFEQKRERIVENYESYYSPQICMGCFIQYGFNKKKKSWESLGGIIELSNQIRKLLNEEYDICYIAKKTTATKNKVYRIIGFLLRNNLFDFKSTEKFIKLISPYDQIKEIYNGLDKKNLIGTSTIRRYRIHPIDFYYHFYSPEVQKNLFVSIRNEEKNDFLLNAQKFIDECLISGEDITFKKFCQTYKVSIRTLKKLEVYDTIQAAKEKQLKYRKQQQEKQLLARINSFFHLNPKKIITVKEVYYSLGISISSIKKAYPNVCIKITELCNQRKDSFYKEKIDVLKVQAKKIVLKEMENYNEFPDMTQLKKELKLDDQMYTKYKEVYEYILELRQSLF